MSIPAQLAQLVHMLMEPNAITAKTLTKIVVNAVTQLSAQNVLVDFMHTQMVSVLPVLKDVLLVLQPWIVYQLLVRLVHIIRLVLKEKLTHV